MSDLSSGFAMRRFRWLELGLLALAQLMLILDVSVINVALPELSRDFGLSLTQAASPIVAYAVPFGGLLLVGGRAADLFGARRMFVVGLVLFTLASLAAGLAPSASILLAARIVQGAGAALLSPSALACLTWRYAGDDRPRALAVWAAVGGAGAALGVLLGGLLTGGFGWRWIFFINVPIGALILLLLPSASSRRPATGRGRLDLFGGLLATLVAAGLIYGLMALGGDTRTGGLVLGASLVLAIVLGIVERRTSSPILDPLLLRQRTMLAGGGAMLIGSAVLVGSFFLLSFLLQRNFAMSPVATGLAFLPVAGGTLAGAHLGGRLLSRHGGRIVAAAGFAVAAAGLASAALAGEDMALLVAALAIGALGVGSTFVAATATALSGIAEDRLGGASGLVNSCHELGGAFGVTVLAGPAAAIGTTMAGLGLAAAVALVAAGAAALLMKRGRPGGPPRFMH